MSCFLVPSIVEILHVIVRLEAGRSTDRFRKVLTIGALRNLQVSRGMRSVYFAISQRRRSESLEWRSAMVIALQSGMSLVCAGAAHGCCGMAE